MHIFLNEENAGWLLAVPGMPMLVALSNDLRRQSLKHGVAGRFSNHRRYANLRTQAWKPYEKVERGIIPDDALMTAHGLGKFYYFPDLKVLDVYGLTDATVARTPVTNPNLERWIAHDRKPPPEYLKQRGVNIRISPPASSATAGAQTRRRRLRRQGRPRPVDALQHCRRAVGRRAFRRPRPEGPIKLFRPSIPPKISFLSTTIPTLASGFSDTSGTGLTAGG